MTTFASVVAIRRVAPADRGFLERCLTADLAERARLAPPKDLRANSAASPPFVRFLLERSRRRHALGRIAEVDGDRAGIIFAGPVRLDPWERPSVRFRRPAVLEECYVLPRFRRTTVGVALFQHATRHFERRGFDWMYAGYHAGGRFQPRLDRVTGFGPIAVGAGKWLTSPTRRRARPPQSESSGGSSREPAPEGLRLRPIVPADRAFLETALDEHMTEKAREALGGELIARPGWGPRYRRALLRATDVAGGRALLAEESSVPAGFVFVHPDRHSARWMRWPLAFSRSCIVDDLYVVPRLRGRRIGERLLGEVERDFARRGFDWMRAFWPAGHRFAADLYRRRGFVVNVRGTGKFLRPTR